MYILIHACICILKRWELHIVVVRSLDYIKRGELYGGVCGE